MRLKKCVFCGKDISLTLSVCPYCRRDEKGQDAAVADAASVTASDPQVQDDLKLLDSDDALAQKSAADRLSQKGPAVVPFLIQFLSRHTHKGSSEAARLLGRLRDRRAGSALLEALKVGDEETRVAAVWALSQLNDPQMLDDLLQECERNNPAVQAYLAHVIPGYQDTRVLPMLMKLAGHSSRDVSFQAIWALGEAGDPAAIFPLRRLLSRRDVVLKAAAETALRRLGGPVRRAVPKLVYWAGGAAGLSAILSWAWHVYK